MATTLLMISEQAFCFRPCSVASALVMAPFVIAFPPAFIVFMGGNMARREEETLDVQWQELLLDNKA